MPYFPRRGFVLGFRGQAERLDRRPVRACPVRACPVTGVGVGRLHDTHPHECRGSRPPPGFTSCELHVTEW